MKKVFLFTVILTGAVLALASLAVADVPPIINYQGFLTKTVGQTQVPVNQPQDFRFSIYDAATSGSKRWGDEVHTCVPVDKGVFTVWLGDADVSPVPLSNTNFVGPNRWLQIEVKPCGSGTYEVLAPRVRLVTVPYSFRVATVDSATGGTIKGDVEIKGKLDVEVASGGAATIGGSTNTAMGLHAVAIGNGNQAGGNNSFAVGSGNEATGWASVAMGQANIATGIKSAAFIWANNVSGENSFAIGANNLVEGNYSGAIGRDLAIAPTGMAGACHVIGRGANGTTRLTNSILNSFMVGYLSDIPTLFVGPSSGAGTTGRVGIGTTAPGYKLDVSDTVQMRGFKMPTGASAGDVLTSDAAGVGTWQPAAAVADFDWERDAPNPNVLFTIGPWGIARDGNILYGANDYTHVNLGDTCTTGTSGQDWAYATVSGGRYNTASNESSTVGGGQSNTSSGVASTVGGGHSNIASGDSATVGGGSSNTAYGIRSTVSGGLNNSASGAESTVGGGQDDTASGARSTVGGGYLNTANGYVATVGGGKSNTASGDSATVGGGNSNVASGAAATIGGGFLNTASGYVATVGGGKSNTASAEYTTIGGGWSNTASGNRSTVSGGWDNTASNSQSTIGGGRDNTASHIYTTVGGGYQNTASAGYSTVGGGIQNAASGQSSTVGGGRDNTASGHLGSVGGGGYNRNLSSRSVILGGAYDTLNLNANVSMAFGTGVYVSDSFRVVFFDSFRSGRLGVNRDDRDGGINFPIHVGTSTSNGNGAYLTNGGVWTIGSSREFKENFQHIDGRELIKTISNMRVEAWQYKDSEERHIGPVAEDFVAAFDVGVVREADGHREDKYLAASDVAGVALVGVQELAKKNQELRHRIEQLESLVHTLLVQQNGSNEPKAEFGMNK